MLTSEQAKELARRSLATRSKRTPEQRMEATKMMRRYRIEAWEAATPAERKAWGARLAEARRRKREAAQ